MLLTLKNKFYIPKPEIKVFASYDRIYNMKKKKEKKKCRNIVIRAITTKYFNLGIKLIWSICNQLLVENIKVVNELFSSFSPFKI